MTTGSDEQRPAPLCHVCGHAEHSDRACEQCECTKAPAPVGTDSARAEAERRYDLGPFDQEAWNETRLMRQAFIAGAEWARAEERKARGPLSAAPVPAVPPAPTPDPPRCEHRAVKTSVHSCSGEHLSNENGLWHVSVEGVWWLDGSAEDKPPAPLKGVVMWQETPEEEERAARASLEAALAEATERLRLNMGRALAGASTPAPVPEDGTGGAM